jgi:hypothetical protein
VVDVDPAVRDEYQEAWDGWRKQLDTLHTTFLEGKPLDAPRLKGLLNREARAKERYDAARLALLGIPAMGPIGGGSVAPPGPPRAGS